MIKARSVYNGRVQRGLYSKEETASPTVSHDAFLLTSIIDAIEGRQVAVTDIKGGYLDAKMKEEVLMKITGEEEKLFCELDPSLEQFVTKERTKMYSTCNWIGLYTDVFNRHSCGTNCTLIH